MKFDGRAFADTLYQQLRETVSRSIEAVHTRPRLCVFLVGDNPSSLSYIKQKRLASEKIGAMLDLHQFLDISYDEFRDAIEKKNRNPDIHGIIIQRPLPDTRTDLMPLLDFIAPEKDIDGFSDASPYEVPVALGVLEILKKIAQRGNTHSLRDFMHNKSVAIIGRGVTAGIPIARMIEKLGSIPAVVHSQTKNPKDVTRGADILISCVGKRKTVTREAIKKGVILIGVGLSRNEDGTYSGDYDEREIEDIASWYTPTPGGVGPVNVASLMKNLVMSYTHSTGGKNL